jgi:phosphatidylglycerol:prolipoprotein diacylglycerol transferase
LFLFFYGVFRFLVEFVREPDAQIGFAALGWMSRGQELSLPMIIGGAGLIIYAYTHNNVHKAEPPVTEPAKNTTNKRAKRA